jgi:AcrR family transcriptional regulator
MPFPRFEKLAPQKRKHLLDVAAREFAIHGFNEASINPILEQAEMSKGAAYYYFEDKVARLRAAVAVHRDQRGRRGVPVRAGARAIGSPFVPDPYSCHADDTPGPGTRRRQDRSA